MKCYYSETENKDKGRSPGQVHTYMYVYNVTKMEKYPTKTSLLIPYVENLTS